MGKQVQKFANGDVVKLKSGGPKMTISGFNQQKQNNVQLAKFKYLCLWFDSEGKEKKTWFNEEVLNPVTKDEI